MNVERVSGILCACPRPPLSESLVTVDFNSGCGGRGSMKREGQQFCVPSQRENYMKTDLQSVRHRIDLGRKSLLLFVRYTEMKQTVVLTDGKFRSKGGETEFQVCPPSRLSDIEGTHKKIMGLEYTFLINLVEIQLFTYCWSSSELTGPIKRAFGKNHKNW